VAIRSVYSPFGPPARPRDRTRSDPKQLRPTNQASISLTYRYAPILGMDRVRCLCADGRTGRVLPEVGRFRVVCPRRFHYLCNP